MFVRATPVLHSTVYDLPSSSPLIESTLCFFLSMQPISDLSLFKAALNLASSYFWKIGYCSQIIFGGSLGSISPLSKHALSSFPASESLFHRESFLSASCLLEKNFG